MLTKNNNIERYIGGGKIYIKLKGETEWREVGEIQKATVRGEVETVEAINYDSCMAITSARAPKKFTGSAEFSTNNINIENMAIAMLGKIEDVTFNTGDTLPDNTTATKEITIKCIKAGKSPIIEGSLKFIGDECGDVKPVFDIHNAIITPAEPFDYIAQEFQQLGFKAEILKTQKGYYDEYRMAVSK